MFLKKIVQILLILQCGYSKNFMFKIIDAYSGNPISEANIIINHSKNQNGTTSNKDGIFFIQSSDSGKINFTINAIGYSDYESSLDLNRIGTSIIKLEKEPYKFSPIDVLSNKAKLLGLGQNYYRVPGSISLITRSEVLEFNDKDINRVIGQVPGVYLQEEDGYGLRPNIGMRGTGLDRSAKINLMEDGILIAPAPYSSPAAYYSPTAARMEAFEIRKGSSQIKYGPHSTGGAINYISASIPEKLDFSGSLEAGNFSTQTAKFKTGVSSNNLGLMFQTHLDNVGGFKVLDGGGDTGYEKKDYLFKARLNSKSELVAMELKLSQTQEVSHETYLGLTKADFYDDPYRRYRASQNDLMDANHNQITFSGAIKISQNTDLTSTFYNNNFHRNWYKLNSVNGDKISAILNEDENTRVSYELLSAYDSEDDVYDIKANNRIYNSQGIQTIVRSSFSMFTNTNQNLMIGLRKHSDEMDRYQWSDLYKMNNGQLILTTAGIAGSGSKNNRLYSARANSIFVEDEIIFNNISITGGVRYERIFLERKDWGNDLNRDSTATSIKAANIKVFIPGIGISYQLANELQLFSGIHKGFSPPGPGIDDEEEVLPEESINFEFGTRYNKGFQTGELVAFYNSYNNLLGEDTQSSGLGSYVQFNGGEVLIQGIEFSFGNIYNLNKILMPVTVSYTFTDAKFKNNFESDFDPWGKVYYDDEIPYIPKNMLHAKIGLAKNSFKCFLRFKYSSKVRTVAGKAEFTNSNSINAMHVADFVIKYQINSNISTDFKIKNISNSKLIASSRPAGYRPIMPRQYLISINFDY